MLLLVNVSETIPSPRILFCSLPHLYVFILYPFISFNYVAPFYSFEIIITLFLFHYFIVCTEFSISYPLNLIPVSTFFFHFESPYFMSYPLNPFRILFISFLSSSFISSCNFPHYFTFNYLPFSSQRCGEMLSERLVPVPELLLLL